MKILWKELLADLFWVAFYYFAITLNIWWLSTYLLVTVWFNMVLYTLAGLLMVLPKFREEMYKLTLPYSWVVWSVLILSKIAMLSFGGWYVSAFIVTVSSMVHYNIFYSKR